MYIVVGRRMYVTVASGSWKTRHIALNGSCRSNGADPPRRAAVAVWPFPLVLTTGYGGGPGGSAIAELEAAALFVPGVVAPAIVISWVFNNTRGSLLLAMLVHGALDATPLPPALAEALSAQYHPLLHPTFGMGVFAVVLLIVTRGRLSYDRYLRDTTQPENDGQSSENAANSCRAL